MNYAKLRGKRAELNLSHKEMGAAIGKSTSAYFRLECGKCRVSVDDAAAITIVADLSYDEFNDIFFDGKLPFGNSSAAPFNIR